jgi:predicted dehydrogenase
MIDIGVIGCGYWGPNLVRNFLAIPGCRVKTVCDMDKKRLAHMKTLYPQVETTTKSETLFDDTEIDAVVVATPAHQHFDLGLKSLAAGKHTFIEKPMTTSSADGIQLIRLAESKTLTLMVGHTFIYSSPVRRIKQIVQNGDLGDIQYISARRLNLGLFQSHANVAWDLAPHDISIILYILGGLPISVNCQGKAHVNPQVEDVTNMTLNFSNGGFATIHNSWLNPNKVREMTVVGSKRMLVYNDVEPIEKIKIFDKRVEIPPHYDSFAEFHYSYHYGDIYSPYLKEFEPLRVESQHFIDCIISGQCAETCGLEALKVIQILEAADKSLKNGGGKVEIEPFVNAPEVEYHNDFSEMEPPLLKAAGG